MPIPNEHAADSELYDLRRWCCAVYYVATATIPTNSELFFRNPLITRIRARNVQCDHIEILFDGLNATGDMVHCDNECGRRTLRHNRRHLFHTASHVIHELIRSLCDEMSRDEIIDNLISVMAVADRGASRPHFVKMTRAAVMTIPAETSDIQLIGARCGLCRTPYATGHETDTCYHGGCINCRNTTECPHCGETTMRTHTLAELNRRGRRFVPTLVPAYNEDNLPEFPCCDTSGGWCDECDTAYDEDHCPNTVYCHACGGFYHTDEDGRCAGCGYIETECEECRTIIHIGGDHPYYDEYGNILCEDCYERIRNEDEEDEVCGVPTVYTSTASDSAIQPIKTKRPLTFGLEVECGISDNGAAMLIDQGWRQVSDGSVNIDDACELISPVCDGTALVDLLSNARPYLKRGRVNKTCGLHLHIGVRKLFSWFELYKVLVYAKLYENVFYATQPPSRQDNTYARRLRVPAGIKTKEQFFMALYNTQEAVRRSIDEKYPYRFANFNRYAWLNFQAYLKQGTLENRLHAGTTDVMKMYHWAVFNAAWIEHAADVHPKNWRSPLDVCPTDTRNYILERIERHNPGCGLDPWESPKDLFTGNTPNKITEYVNTKKGTTRCVVSLAW